MSRSFAKVNVEITNICNLQCSFCPEVVRTKKMMDPELFRKVAKEVSAYTRVVCLHLMGDPLVHPKLREIVEICNEFKLQIFFVTNGVLLKEKDVETLLHFSMRQVSFSLHSFADNFPGQDPGIYLERIFNFTDRALAERPFLFINYRLWNLQTTRGLQDKNVDMLKRIEKHFGVAIPNSFDLSSKKNFVIKSRFSLHFDVEFTWPSPGLAFLGSEGTCHALSSHFGVLVDGTVVPCCLDKEGDIALGKIPDQKLPEILKSERAQAMLKGFRSHQLVEDLCQRCQYIERFQENSKVV